MGNGRNFSVRLSFFETSESSTEVSYENLSSLVEEDLTSLVNSLISEARHVLHDESDNMVGLPFSLLEEIQERSLATSRETSNGSSNLLHKSSAFIEQCEILFTAKYQSSYLLLSHLSERCRLEERRIGDQDFLQKVSHVLVFKRSIGVLVRPETEVESIYNKDIGHELL